MDRDADAFVVLLDVLDKRPADELLRGTPAATPLNPLDFVEWIELARCAAGDCKYVGALV